MGCNGSTFDLDITSNESQEDDVHNHSFIDNIKSRRSIKNFQKVDSTNINISPILDAIALTPTSFGLQPFSVKVVKDDNLKRELSTILIGESQINECTYLLIFCANTDATRMCDRYIYQSNINKNNPEYCTQIKGVVGSKNQEDMLAWSHAQVVLCFNDY